MRFVALVAAMMLPAMAVAEPGDGGLQISAPTQEDTTLSTGVDAAFRMTVPVMVNGQGPFHFVIDTGADRTVISRETADQLALPQAGTKRLHAMGGSGQVRMVKVDQLQMSNRTAKHLKLAALPRQYLGADGLLGLDSLKGQRIVMDFKTGTMTLQSAGSPDASLPDGSDLIVVTARTRLGQLVLADADVNGEKVWVIVDTGAQNSVGNSRLRRLLLSRNPKTTVTPIEMIDVLGRRFPGDYTIVNRVRIGGVLMGNAAIAFADAHPFKLFGLDKKPSMLLGMEGLRSFERVSVDFATKKVTFMLPKVQAKP
ncbi:MAG: hypothetical protein RL425_785 [Pseudomonadota bacterium]|jgi:predicted aspartyl protease